MYSVNFGWIKVHNELFSWDSTRKQIPLLWALLAEMLWEDVLNRHNCNNPSTWPPHKKGINSKEKDNKLSFHSFHREPLLLRKLFSLFADFPNTHISGSLHQQGPWCGITQCSSTLLLGNLNSDNKVGRTEVKKMWSFRCRWLVAPSSPVQHKQSSYRLILLLQKHHWMASNPNGQSNPIQ